MRLKYRKKPSKVLSLPDIIGKTRGSGQDRFTQAGEESDRSLSRVAGTEGLLKSVGA